MVSESHRLAFRIRGATATPWPFEAELVFSKGAAAATANPETPATVAVSASGSLHSSTSASD